MIKKKLKKLLTLVMLFAFIFTTFTTYPVNAETTPKKGDLKFEGITSYIEADSTGRDIGLVNKVDQYTSVNGESVEVSSGLFGNAIDNDVTTIDKLSENDVEVRKIVTKVNDTGKYKINFEVRGKGTKLQLREPVYIVVVFDNSNSMAPRQNSSDNCENWVDKSNLNETSWNYGEKGRCYDKWYEAINGAKEFAKIVHNNIPSANIALVSFAGESNRIPYSDSKEIRGFSASNFENLNVEGSTFSIPRPSSSGQKYAAGGTNLEAGLRHARELLSDTSKVPANALKYVVVMGDGEPSFYYDYNGITQGTGSGYNSTGRDYAVAEANRIKRNLNGKIYSIGYEIDNGSKAEEALNAISSNVLTNGKYTGDFYTNGSVENIATKFTDIAQEIIQDAGINAYINDNIGPAFRGTGTGVSKDGTKYESQVIPSIYEKWTPLGEFTIQIDPDSPTGWYKTNEGFTLTYYDVVNEKTRVIECNDDPEVYWIQNTYDYQVRFYYGDNSGNYEEDSTLRQNLKAAHNQTVSELTSEIMDSTHLKKGYKFVEVKDENYVLIDELDNKYSIVVDKNSTENIIRVYYEKIFTLDIKKVVDEYDQTKPEMNKSFQFEIKLTDNQNKPISGTYLYKLNNGTNILKMNFNNYGISTFTLKHNDTISFIDLPKNVKYEIKELYSDGFVVEITKPNGLKDINTTTGALYLNSNQQVTFLNITGYILPETGSSQTIILAMVAMFLLGTPIINLIYSFIKKDL